MIHSRNTILGVEPGGSGPRSKLIGTVGFSFTSMGDVAGGAPRFSIPIDDGLGTADLYAFLDAANCGRTSGGTTVVSTSLANCTVFPNNGPSFGNWAAFAAADPTYRIRAGGIPFIISDQPGTYIVSNIVLR